MQISKISYKNSKYPDLLREIHNPPKQLFVAGEIGDGPFVSIVGSRACSSYGKYVTHQFAYDLAKAGVTIVSGLAYGIDSIAHSAALQAGGKTVAVLAGGIDVAVVAGNRGIARTILNNGAIISEYPLGIQPLPGTFVARNRVVAGISPITIVTECKASSGALITASLAFNENRQVYAVPGSIQSLYSAGPNNLLRELKASAITSASDVLDVLEDGEPKKLIKAQSKEEASVIALIEEGINTSQQLIERSDMSASQFAQVITLMEITGKVRNLGAGYWSLR